MPKYIRSSRSSSSSSSSNSLRDAMLRDLEKEGEKLLKKMTDQFTRDLQKQGSQVLKELLGGSSGSKGTNTALTNGVGLATNLIGTLLTHALSGQGKTTTSTATRESDRSSAESFRVSRAQAMAEATAELARSERNT